MDITQNLTQSKMKLEIYHCLPIWTISNENKRIIFFHKAMVVSALCKSFKETYCFSEFIVTVVTVRVTAVCEKFYITLFAHQEYSLQHNFKTYFHKTNNNTYFRKMFVLNPLAEYPELRRNKC